MDFNRVEDALPTEYGIYRGIVYGEERDVEWQPWYHHFQSDSFSVNGVTHWAKKLPA